jgi:hypothetical protein
VKFCVGVKFGFLHGVRVFENRMLRRIFGSKRDEAPGGWRRRGEEEFVTCALDQIL